MPQRTPRIDVHTHMLERTASEAGAPHSVVTGFGARSLPPPVPGSAQARADRAGYDVELHIEMLDQLALDAEVLSSLTVMQGTGWASPEQAHDLNRRVNDAIATWASEHPTRIVGSFTLPLPSRERSIAELERCAGELEMRVVQLPVASTARI
ncbi:MAG: amidohydrolase family protein [Solirubrobacterales bacterium]|nr:amidohydrolase family protein [Solirubrobacterales bacterium]MBV9716009.1 amidohydrolase family protein [Solirubrobacterales bacterium]